MQQFLLIEDHEIMRMGMRLILTSIYPGCIIKEARNEDEAILQLKGSTYDLILTDVQMPGTDIFRLLTKIRKDLPQTPVLVLSMISENIFARKLLKAGAHGFVSKEAGSGELLRAIQLVMSGRKYISEAMVETLSQQTGNEDNPFEQLTQRELEICRLLIAHNSITKISETLHISTSTAGTHKARIFRKLEVENVFQLIDLGKQYNFLN